MKNLVFGVFTILVTGLLHAQTADIQVCSIKGKPRRVYLDALGDDSNHGSSQRFFIEEQNTQHLIEVVNDQLIPIELESEKVVARGRLYNNLLVVSANDQLGLRAYSKYDDFTSINECSLEHLSSQVEMLQEPETFNFEPYGDSDVIFDSSVDPTAKPVGGLDIPLGSTFKLHSLPSSPLKIYLDFNGHTSKNNTWTRYFGRNPIFHPTFSIDNSDTFSNYELQIVQQVWQNVSAAFSPFNIDVTTEEPPPGGLARESSSDKSYGIRIIITRESSSYAGLTMMNTFVGDTDVGGFVYQNSFGNGVRGMSVVVAHEVGHTLGLNHDGQNKTVYYTGHGSGSTSWTPIMGAGYTRSIAQWSQGEYFNSNNKEDDLKIMTTQNADVRFRTSDHATNFNQARELGKKIQKNRADTLTFGVIAGTPTAKDIDYFMMSVSNQGQIDLTIHAGTEVYISGNQTPLHAISQPVMLDLRATLYNENGQVVYVADSPSESSIVLQVSRLPKGRYFLTVEGTGYGNPTSASPTGYTSYGSLGSYIIQGSYSTY